VTNASNVCHKLNCILCHVLLPCYHCNFQHVGERQKMPQHLKLLFLHRLETLNLKYEKREFALWWNVVKCSRSVSKVSSTINDSYEIHKIHQRAFFWLKSDDVMWKVMTFIWSRFSVAETLFLPSIHVSAVHEYLELYLNYILKCFFPIASFWVGN
jgi:hypothetical protein